MKELKKLIIGLEAVLCVLAVGILRTWYAGWAFDGAVLVFALVIGWLLGTKSKEEKRGKEYAARMKERWVIVLLLVPIAITIIVYALKALELLQNAA